MRRIFGGPMSESVQDEWPELAKAWAQQELRMPRETTATNRVRPMNRLEKFLTGDATALANPIGTIAVNRDVVTQDRNLDDTLVHELTHMGQKPRGLVGYLKSAGTPWENRPEEKEAMKAEEEYSRKKRGDIYLRPDKKR